MNRLVWAVVVAVSATSCMEGRSKPAGDAIDPVDRALTAVGGADKLSALDTIVVKGTAKQWEPEQSLKADGEPRFANEATFVLSRSFSNKAARIEWDKKFAYPSPREYKYTEIVTAAAGLVEGIDSTGRTKRDLESNPPRHTMSSVRLAATQRELWRASPRLLLMMKSDPSKLSLTETSVGGKSAPAVQYQINPDVAFLVVFDASGLPSRVRTMDADGVYGDSAYDLVLSDWRDVSGVKIAHRRSYELNGKEVMHVEIQEVTANAPIAAEQLQIPADLVSSASKPATGKVPYQWAIRRQFIGTYLDADPVNFDTGGSLRLADLAPGISQVVGGSHNSFVVEMADQVVVFDAPVNEWQSRWTLDAIKSKYPGKPVKTLVLTHHHMDHVSGARTYVAQGANVLTGKGNAAHFEKMFSAPHTVDGDALQQSPRRAEISEIEDMKVLDDGKRRIEIVRIENPHAEGMLLTYVPDAKIGFVVDLWSPGRDKLPDKINPALASVVAGVKRFSSTPEKLAGGHGSTAEYAPLAALAGPLPQASK